VPRRDQIEERSTAFARARLLFTRLNVTRRGSAAYFTLVGNVRAFSQRTGSEDEATHVSGRAYESRRPDGVT